MNGKHFILGGALVLAAPAFAQAQKSMPAHSEKEMKADADVLKKLHKANREEIELSQVAQRQSSRDEVKQFAKTMVDDHQMADEKVMKMAEMHGMTLGEEPEAMKEAEKLGKKMGNDFDREYLSKMVKGHEKVTSMVTGKMKDVSPELQTALTDMLPTLRKHEMEAKQMLDQVKGSHEAQGRRSSEYDHQQR